MREILISRKLNHKNIVELKEYHETINSIYLIYEHLKGPPIFRTSIPLTVNLEEIKEIMFNLLQGLKHLEDMNIVHRDLKPYNILFKARDDYSSLKILDFGLSCPRFDSSQIFKICGTPGFIAPEMFRVGPNQGWTILNNSLDVFSAGVIFHYLLFEKLIYDEDWDNPEIAYENNQKGIAKIGKIGEMRGDVKSWKAYYLMRKMLEKDPKERIRIEDALKDSFFDGVEKALKSDTERNLDFEVPQEPENDIETKLKLKQFVCHNHKKLFRNFGADKLKEKLLFESGMRNQYLRASDVLSLEKKNTAQDSS